VFANWIGGEPAIELSSSSSLNCFAHRTVPNLSGLTGPISGFGDFALMDSAGLLNLPGQRLDAHSVLTHFC
jgi:hypothetical protein